MVSSFHASSLGQELTGNAIEIGIENLRLQHVGVPHTNHHEWKPLKNIKHGEDLQSQMVGIIWCIFELGYPAIIGGSLWNSISTAPPHSWQFPSLFPVYPWAHRETSGNIGKHRETPAPPCPGDLGGSLHAWSWWPALSTRWPFGVASPAASSPWGWKWIPVKTPDLYLKHANLNIDINYICIYIYIHAFSIFCSY